MLAITLRTWWDLSTKMKLLLCFAAFLVGCFMTVQFGPEEADEVTVEETAIGPDANPSGLNAGEAFAEESFGTLKTGEKVTKFICQNANGLVLEMTDYGATVLAVKTKDKNDKLDNITLSCNDIAGYQELGAYFGCTVGRYCNRIAGGKFGIDGTEYSLATNNGKNHLHGGKVGFDKRMWKCEPIKKADATGLRFSLTSDDGDEGYPGKLEVTAEYLLTNKDELIVDLKAKTDKATHVNLTNHCYWNLSGEKSGKILGQELKIEADKYIPVDGDGIPTGDMPEVSGTPFDFADFHSIGKRIKLVGGKPIGYDHCYVLRNQTGKMALAATVRDPSSGRSMEVHTTQPGLQFYSGNFLDGSDGTGGFNQHDAFCLETQHYPDAPNRPKFKSTLLKPGETYHQTTVHKFGIYK